MYQLVHGQETFLSLDRAKKIARNISQESSSEFVTIDAESSSPDSIIDMLGTNNMFQTENIFLIKRVYRNKKKDEIIEYILKHLGDNQSTYIFWEDQKINKTTKYFKFFKSNVELFEKGDKRSTNAWLKDALDEKKISYDQRTLTQLASRCNYLSERIFHVIEKIDLSGEQVLTEKLIEEMTEDTLEIYAWDLTDAINRKDQSNALVIFENLMSQQVDPNLILAMLANNLKGLAQVNLMLQQGEQSSTIAKSTGLHPFVVSKLMSSARATRWSDIKSLFEKLTSLDLSSKKGEIDLTLGLTILLTRIN